VSTDFMKNADRQKWTVGPSEVNAPTVSFALTIDGATVTL